MPNPYVGSHHPLLTLTPQEIGKLENNLAAQEKELGFQTFTEVCRPPELATIPKGAHQLPPILRHTSDHSVLINFSQGLEKEEKETAL